MQSQRSHILLGPKKIRQRDFYLLLRREETVLQTGKNSVLSLTFSPVAIWEKEFYAQLEEAEDWKEYLTTKIMQMEG